jgi:hypothetical protein
VEPAGLVVLAQYGRIQVQLFSTAPAAVVVQVMVLLLKVHRVLVGQVLADKVEPPILRADAELSVLVLAVAVAAAAQIIRLREVVVVVEEDQEQLS